MPDQRHELVSRLFDAMERPAAVEAIRQRCTDRAFAEILVHAEAIVERASLAPNPQTALLALTVALAFYDEAYGKLRALIGCDARPQH